MSTIYGIYTGNHSSCVCLMRNGEIVLSLEEERFTRIKSGDNYDSNCELSSKIIQEKTGLKIVDSDYRVAVAPVPAVFVGKITNNNYEEVSHHDSHAYGAYYTSGFEEKTLTITYDGGGENTVMKVFLCEDGKMNLIHSRPMPSYGSLSHLWGFATSSIMGYDKHFEGVWKMCKDEGKLMGMAADGHYDEKIYRILNSIIDYKNLRFFPSNTSSRTMITLDTMFNMGEFSTQEKRNIFCYNLQKLTNDLFLNFLNDLHKLYPEYKKLCFSGGLFANVKLNQKINELNWVDEIYVLPPMGDEGLALGACIYKAVQLGEITKPKKLNDVFFGISYSNDEIYEISKEFDFKRVEYSPEKIAKEINKGSIVGWFQGGSEHGPRALGARSILVKPTDINTHKVLNERLRRHDTMPFAPIILSEKFEDVFTTSKSKYTAEFMTLCFSTKEEWIDKIPAVIQKSDKTARPQVVCKEKLPKFWSILNEYYKLSGIPLLLNTSFNSHNEPIIENPIQAFSALKKGIIDKLIIEDYVYFN